MPLIYKIDILNTLKNKGYTTYKLRKDQILGEKTIQNLRQQKPINWGTVEVICDLLDCQPGDIIEFVKE